MPRTTITSISITLIIFLIWGFTIDGKSDLGNVAVVQEAIDSKFNINGWLFLVPATVIFLIVKKMPALPALLIGTLFSGISGFVVIWRSATSCSKVESAPRKAVDISLTVPIMGNGAVTGFMFVGDTVGDSF